MTFPSDSLGREILKILHRILWILLLAVFAGLLLHFNGTRAKAESPYSSGIPFEWRIVDGDTISTVSRPRTYYRFVGFDAPEISRPRCDRELLHGEKAKRYLEGLLKEPGLLWFDPGNLDIYGRRLVYIWIRGRNVSDLMVAANLGVKSDGKRKFNWCKHLAP